MEDEGNWQVLAICDTRDEVAQFVKKYVEDCDGFFKVSNLVYVGSHFSPGGMVDVSLQPFLPMNMREYLVPRSQT
jgi:hypothetical protein